MVLARTQSLGSVVEQLKGYEAKVVLSVTGAGKAKAMKRWKERVQKLNDTYAEGKNWIRSRYAQQDIWKEKRLHYRASLPASKTSDV